MRKLDEKNITFSKPVSRPSFVIALSNESAIFEDGEMVIGAGLLAVTVCDRAKQVCPVCSTETQKLCKSPRARAVILRSFMDPASAVGSEEEQLDSFRRARDEIMEWISQTFGR